MNLVEVGKAFANEMLHFSSQNLSVFAGIHDPYIDTSNYDYMRNGNGHEVLQLSMQLGYKQTLSTKDRVVINQIVVFVAMSVVILAIGIFVFFPILRHIEQNADEIMKQFVALPPAVRKYMHTAALARVRILRRDFAPDDEGESSSEDEQAGEIAANKLTLDPGYEEDDVDDESQVNWDELVDKPGKSPSRRMKSDKTVGDGDWCCTRSSSGGSRSGGKRAQRLFRKSSRSFLVLTLRFIGPLVVLLLLFVLMFSVFQSTMNRSVTLTSVAAVANERASCARQAMVDLRKLEYLTTDWRYIRNSYWFTMEAVQCVRQRVRLLGYGDSMGITGAYLPYTPPVENGFPSDLSLESTQVVYEAMFGNACPFLQTIYGPSFNQSYCESLNGGILRNGLSAATEEWYSYADQAGDRQLRGLFIVGHLDAGWAWLVPSETFNYSSMACDPADGCVLHRDFSSNNGMLPPTPLSDFSYIGDFYESDTPPNGSVPYRIAHELTMPLMQSVLLADTVYLTPAFLAIADIYQQEAKDNINNFLNFLAVFMPCYMAFFAGVIAFIFMPQIHRTNLDIQTKRAMLLYLPPEIVSRIASIREMVAAILAGDTTGIGRKSS
jgi:hypothetical protein